MPRKVIFNFKTIQSISSLHGPDFRKSDSTAIRDMESALLRLKEFAMKAPMNRMGTADAHLVDLGDLVDYSNPGGNKLLSRRFEEIEESAGDSLFTEFYANGRIEEQHLSVVHHLGAFDSGAKGIKTGMRREMLAKELGKETWKSERISIYSCVDPVERLNGNPKATYECAWFFFENGLLIGMTFHLMGDC